MAILNGVSLGAMIVFAFMPPHGTLYELLMLSTGLCVGLFFGSRT